MVSLTIAVAVVGAVLLVAFGMRTLLREVVKDDPKLEAPAEMKRPHQVTITAANGPEALALKTALADPQTRAFVLVVGSLLVLVGSPLGPEARKQALRYVADREVGRKD